MKRLGFVVLVIVPSRGSWKRDFCTGNKRPHVLHGKFVDRIWTQNRCGASSRSSAGQASSYWEGDVWKINLSCSLRIKQMIMTGIMSEGSAGPSDSTYAER